MTAATRPSLIGYMAKAAEDSRTPKASPCACVLECGCPLPLSSWEAPLVAAYAPMINHRALFTIATLALAGKGGDLLTFAPINRAHLRFGVWDLDFGIFVQTIPNHPQQHLSLRCSC